MKKIQWPIRRSNFLIPARELPPKKIKDSNPYTQADFPARAFSDTAVYLGLPCVKAFYTLRALRQQVCDTSSETRNVLPVFSWASELWPQSKWIWEENTLIRHSLSQALGF